MKQLIKIIVLLSTLTIASVFAYPQESNDYVPHYSYPYADGTNGPAVYAGGMAGLTNYTGTSYYSDGSTAASSTQSGAIGLMGNVGIMLNQYIGIEAGYVRFGDLSNKIRVNGSVVEENDNFTGPMLNVKGVFPFGNGFNIFGKLGFSSITAHSNLPDFDNRSYSGLNLGLGVGYYFTPNIEGTVEYLSTMINSKSNTSFTPSIFGFGFNFHL